MSRRSVIAAVTLVAGLTASLRAQTVRGVVVLPNDDPAPGVIVVALDQRGAAVARALANARGEFVLHTPAAGRFSLQLLRIGYRPIRGPEVPLASDATVTTRLVFVPKPVVLPAVNVNVSETCNVGADTGLAIARVWDEARKAMLSTQLNADNAPLVAEWIEYERNLDSSARIVRDQRVRTSRHPTTHAFRSQTAEFLADSGYVVADKDVATFYVPDVDVLLSESFAFGHCFGLVAPPGGSEHLIGVAFHPSDARRAFRDIEGTLWLDRKSAELRRLNFTYTNLPTAALGARPGGSVDFMRLDEGIWIVSRWNVRMPQLATERPMFSGLRRIVVAGSRVALRAVKESGGEVTAVGMRDSVLYQVLGAEILLQAVGGDILIRGDETMLTLDGTDYVATADASGRLALSPVLPGRYHARVRTPLMDSLGIAAVERDVEAGSDARVDTIVLPRAHTLLELIATDTGGRQLPGVQVDIQPSHGSGRSLTTGANGHALMHDLPPGVVRVNARKLGFQPVERRLSMAEGRTVLPVVMRQRVATTLDTVTVVVDSATPLPRHEEFETRRRNHEATVSITREDIRRRNPAQAWQMLTTVPSIKIVDNDTMVIVRSTRTSIASLLSNDHCWTLIAIDGVVLNRTAGQKGFDLRQLPHPDEIYGMEVFAGAASIPLRYGGEGDGKWCGLIAIWTR